MEEVYLIYWWCPEPYERESRFYAVNADTGRETLRAFAEVEGWMDKWRGRDLSKVLDDFEIKEKERLGLTRLNIKPTHKLHVPIKEVIKHYKRFIKPENIIDIEISRGPQSD